MQIASKVVTAIHAKGQGNIWKGRRECCHLTEHTLRLVKGGKWNRMETNPEHHILNSNAVKASTFKP
jgi:hypothetical protein